MARIIRQRALDRSALPSLSAAQPSCRRSGLGQSSASRYPGRAGRGWLVPSPRPCAGVPSACHSSSPGGLDASNSGADAVGNHCAFKLGKHTHHLKQGLSAGRGGVDVLLVQEEINLGRVQFL
jgi:hypothetical protein